MQCCYIIVTVTIITIITQGFLTHFSVQPPQAITRSTQVTHRPSTETTQKRKRSDMQLSQTPTKTLQVASPGREPHVFVSDITQLYFHVLLRSSIGTGGGRL